MENKLNNIYLITIPHQYSPQLFIECSSDFNYLNKQYNLDDKNNHLLIETCNDFDLYKKTYFRRHQWVKVQSLLDEIILIEKDL